MGKKVFLRKPFYTLYPNLFTVLVAGSARCRKTTALNMACSMLMGMDESLIRAVEGKTSTEKFIHGLSTSNGGKPFSTIIRAEELSVMLTKDAQGDKMMDVLTALFDCPPTFSYNTFKHGKVEIRDPYVTVLAASTPESIEKVLPDLAVGGGFTSRIIFVFQHDTEKERTDFEEPTEKERKLFTRLQEDIKKIAALEGGFSLHPDAKDVYLKYYKEIEEPEDRKLDGFVNRKHDHVLRTAMILRAAMLEDSTIYPPQVEAAITAVEAIQTNLPRALAGVGTKAEIKSVYDRIIRIIYQNKQISYSDLLKRCYGHTNAAGLRDALETLTQAGYITTLPDNHRIFVYCGPKDFKT